MNIAKSLLAWAVMGLIAASMPVIAAPASQTANTSTHTEPAGEVIYHIFVRSFADSNGDRIGDLEGITAKLDYIKQLGATAVLLTPLQPSPYYHNYFATDFKAIDPAYGSMQDYFKFIRTAHALGLKVYLDEEIQYVAEGHPWWQKSICKPHAKYADYLLWKGDDHCVVVPFMGKAKWRGYDGKKYGIAMVNMNNPAVLDYFTTLLTFWADPHGDGSGRDGVDGFRIDHMMDDLDHKGLDTDLLATFWTPLIEDLKALRPELKFFAEQASWGFGDPELEKGSADMAYAYPLYRGLVSLNKDKIVDALHASAEHAVPGKTKVTLIEGHDVDRFMSIAHGNPAKARAAAAILLTIKGVPMIYYGQELGMDGRNIHTGAITDGMGIPVREAFRWKTDLKAPGSAIWYKGDQPWWTERYNRSGDGVSLQAERAEPHSLYHWYKQLLALRHARPELHAGSQKVLCEDDTEMLCVIREKDGQRTLLIVNLGMNAGRPQFDPEIVGGVEWVDLLHGGEAEPLDASLQPMQVRIVGTPDADR